MPISIKTLYRSKPKIELDHPNEETIIVIDLVENANKLQKVRILAFFKQRFELNMPVKREDFMIPLKVNGKLRVLPTIANFFGGSRWGQQLFPKYIHQNKKGFLDYNKKLIDLEYLYHYFSLREFKCPQNIY